MKEMNAVVDKMKTVKVEKIGGINVVATRDYSIAKRTLKDGTVEDMDTAKVNAVYYELEDGGFVCIRPSGTEPKLKVYYSLKAENAESAKELFAKVKADFEEKIK
jgi:phosphoglucomutase